MPEQVPVLDVAIVPNLCPAARRIWVLFIELLEPSANSLKRNTVVQQKFRDGLDTKRREIWVALTNLRRRLPQWAAQKPLSAAGPRFESDRFVQFVIMTKPCFRRLLQALEL